MSDREDEEMQFETSRITDFSKATANTEQISAFTSPPKSSSRDTIRSESMPHNSAPKPRFTYGGLETIASEIQTPWSSSIADRAKTRIRNSALSSSKPAQTSPSSEIINISSDSDDELIIPLPRRAKQRDRKQLDNLEFNLSSSQENSSHPPDTSQAMSIPPIAILEGTGGDDPEAPQSDFFASSEVQLPCETAEKTSKKSKKSKTKEEKGKKNTKKRRTSGSAADDAPGKSRRAKKGKTRDIEVFRSKEFIDDEDEPTDEQQVPARSPDYQEPAGLNPVTDSVTEDEKVTHTAADANDPLTGRMEPPIIRTNKGRKRKANCDDEFDDIEDAPKRKARTKKDGPKATHKAKSVIHSDEDFTMVESDKENREGSSQAGAPVFEAMPKEGKGESSSKDVSPATPRPASAKPSFSLVRSKSTPMTELIKRVNSRPNSPFPKPSHNGATAYSPYLKSSRSALSRIAPLHPNRRTPPPPPPPPPPPKKTKKQLEQEEKWEEELIEEAGGITEWSCMTDLDRKELRRMKREREMRGWED